MSNMFQMEHLRAGANGRPQPHTCISYNRLTPVVVSSDTPSISFAMSVHLVGLVGRPCGQCKAGSAHSARGDAQSKPLRKPLKVFL